MCFPETAAEVQACVRAARRHGRPFVATRRRHRARRWRGAVRRARWSSSRRGWTRILEVDVANGIAWVEPGVLNLDLTRVLAPYGLHFAPDPSSQQSCTIGGNVANNSGGPHCLAVRRHQCPHRRRSRSCWPTATLAVLGGIDPEPTGLDLRGAFVGSEGTMGIATRIAVRLTPIPPAVRTLLLDFDPSPRPPRP